MSNPSPTSPVQLAKALWQSTTKVFLSDDIVDVIYKDLAGLEVSLDADPLAYGPKRLQEKVAMCRKHLSATERLFLNVSHAQHRLRKDFRAKQSALELSTKFLYATDPEVRAGRSLSDREAFASIKLKDEWLDVSKIEQTVNDMDAVLYVIKAKRTDLRDTQSRLRDQIRLCGQEIGLGGRWGSKVPQASELEPGQGSAKGSDLEDVLTLIEGVEAELAVGPLPDEPNEHPNTFVNPDDEITFEGWDDPPEEKALPSNGVDGDELDRLLSSVDVPSFDKPKKMGIMNPITELDGF